MDDQNSSSAEAITSHKRPACDFNLLAAKRQCLGPLRRPGYQAEAEARNNHGVQPGGFLINDCQHVQGVLQQGAVERGLTNDYRDLAEGVVTANHANNNRNQNNEEGAQLHLAHLPSGTTAEWSLNAQSFSVSGWSIMLVRLCWRNH